MVTSLLKWPVWIHRLESFSMEQEDELFLEIKMIQP